MDKKTVYIAGPMRGFNNFNFDAFDAARDLLLAEGWNVISPADLDRATGFDPYGSLANPSREFLEAAMRRDVEAIMQADAIYMLNGWQKSTGAKAELALAKWRHIEILFEPGASPDDAAKESILDVAQRVTTGDRRRDYDRATPNHERIAGAWNWYIQARKNPQADLSPLDVATMMILLKIARACNTPTKDSYVDIAGYAKCCSQIAGFEPQ